METNVQPPTTKKNNGVCLTGFIFGCASVILSDIGIIPLSGIIISIVGMFTFKKSEQKNFWMGYVGLILNILYLLVHANNRGYFS